MRIKANGISFSYAIDGKVGARCIVFSNSLATNFAAWDNQIKAVQNSFHTLRYDQRGHGRTEAPSGRYNFDLLVADAIALLEALNIKRAHWVGLSMGGATGLGIAQRRPDLIERLVVCDTTCASTPESAQQWEARIAVATKNGMDALIEPTVSRWFPEAAYKGKAPYIDNVREMIRTTPVNGFIGCAAALADYDLRPSPKNVKQPVLFLVGDQDGSNPAAMRGLHRALPGSHFAELRGAGHICNLDRPEHFNAAITNFLR